MKKSLRYSFLLLLAACIWGSAFVAQSEGMEHVGAFTFNGIRNFLGCLVLLPFIMIRDSHMEVVESKFTDKDLLLGGFISGIFLFLASSAQTIALKYSEAGKAGFVTTLYIVLVPIMSLILKKKPGKNIFVSVILACGGLYLLCVKEGAGFTLGKEDPYLLSCAFLFACQIMVIDHYAPKVDCVKLSLYQFLTVGVLSIIPMIFEAPTLSDLKAVWLPICYAGFLSSGIAYTLQVIGQRHVKASLASLLMSFESVFSVLFGFLILKEKLSVREGIGCIIMFIAVITAQIFPGERTEP